MWNSKGLLSGEQTSHCTLWQDEEGATEKMCKLLLWPIELFHCSGFCQAFSVVKMPIHMFLSSRNNTFLFTSVCNWCGKRRSSSSASATSYMRTSANPSLELQVVSQASLALCYAHSLASQHLVATSVTGVCFSHCRSFAWGLELSELHPPQRWFCEKVQAKVLQPLALNKPPCFPCQCKGLLAYLFKE